MATPFTTQFTSLGQRLMLAAKAMERGQIDLAERINVHRNTVTRWVKDKNIPSDAQINEIAAVTGFDPHWLKTGQGEPKAPSVFERLLKRPRDDAEFEAAFARGMAAAGLLPGNDTEPAGDELVPVRGTAAGALAGSMAMSGDAIDWVRRPPGLGHVRDAYALYVIGSSMEDRYRAGDLIFVHPHRPVRPGDIVVVQTQTHDGADIVSWLKEYVLEDAREVVARQYNKLATIRFKKSTVTAIHRVLSTGELFGL
jgi:phage repressor protein C with HTH and peptisase S24 domain